MALSDYTVGSLADLIAKQKGSSNISRGSHHVFVKSTIPRSSQTSDSIEKTSKPKKRTTKSFESSENKKKVTKISMKRKSGNTGAEEDPFLQNGLKKNVHINKKSKQSSTASQNSTPSGIEPKKISNKKMKKGNKNRRVPNDTIVKKPAKKEKPNINNITEEVIFDGPDSDEKSVEILLNHTNLDDEVLERMSSSIKKSSQNSNTTSAAIRESNTARTIFVGNVPVNTSKIELKNIFKKYGVIETIRLRDIPVPDNKTSKKVAAITQKFHPSRTSVNAYIRFIKNEDSKKAPEENGILFKGHHLRVNHCCDNIKSDGKWGIFVGNLSYECEEEELWNAFESCGKIISVRLIRDSKTSIGKGFGYVNFAGPDSVELALQMENVMIRQRPVRISVCDNKPAKFLKEKSLYKKRKAKKYRNKNNQ